LEEVPVANAAAAGGKGKTALKPAAKTGLKTAKPAAVKTSKATTTTTVKATVTTTKQKTTKAAAVKPVVAKNAAPKATRKTRSSDVKPVVSSSSDQITDQTTGVHSKRKSRTSQAAGILKDTEQEVVVAKKVKTIPHDDLDEEDENDPMMVSEYVNEIFEYLRELEVR
jgi:G2/mitotic-specific cyclin 2